MNDNSTKAWIRGVFDRAASGYGVGGCRYFDEFGRQLVALAHLKPGEKILDVATGKGAILFPAAQAIGEAGEAVGIDLSSAMIEEARKRGPQTSIRLLVMDAEHLSFPDHSFDVVFCGFALFFFPHLTQVLEEFKRVLKPGGRIAVSIWGKSSPLTQWVVSRAEQLSALKQLKAQRIDTSDILKQTLLDAGFHKVTIQEKEETFWHATPEEWWDSLWTHGTRARLEQLSPDNLTILRRDALEHAARISHDGRIGETMHAIFGVAER